MKIQFLCLALMVIALVLMTAPPTFARINDPIFGMPWRPDMCFNPYEWICADGYNAVAWSSNNAIDWANNFSGCSDGQCLFDSYTQYLLSDMPAIYAFTLLGSQEEGMAWIMQLAERFIMEQAWAYNANYGGGCTAC